MNSAGQFSPRGRREGPPAGARCGEAGRREGGRAEGGCCGGGYPPPVLVLLVLPASGGASSGLLRESGGSKSIGTPVWVPFCWMGAAAIMFAAARSRMVSSLGRRGAGRGRGSSRSLSPLGTAELRAGCRGCSGAGGAGPGGKGREAAGLAGGAAAVQCQEEKGDGGIGGGRGEAKE